MTTPPPDLKAIAEELANKINNCAAMDAPGNAIHLGVATEHITQALTQAYERGASEMRERAAIAIRQTIGHEYSASEKVVRSLPLTKETP